MADLPKGYILDKTETKPASKTPLFLPPPGYQIDEPHMASGDEMTQVAKQAAPYLGRFAANSLPMVGGAIGGIPGAGLGSLGAIELRNEFPQTFGEGPKDPIDFAKTLGVDLTTQGILPKMVEGLTNRTGSFLASRAMRNFPALRNGAAKEMSNQIMQHMEPNSGILEGAAQDAKGMFDNLKGDYTAAVKNLGEDHPFVEEAKQALKDKFGKNSVGKSLVRLQKEYELGGDVAKSQTYQSIANTALSDLTHVRNWKLVAPPQAIADLASNKLLTGGFKEASGAIDATKVLGELKGKNAEVYKEALGDSFGSFKDMLSEIKSQQAGHETSDRIINWSKGHLTWAATLGIGGLLGGHGLGGGLLSTGMAAPAITNSFLAKAMANPQTAQLVVKALRTSASAPEAGFIHKALMGALRGSLDVATTPER